MTSPEGQYDCACLRRAPPGFDREGDHVSAEVGSGRRAAARPRQLVAGRAQLNLAAVHPARYAERPELRQLDETLLISPLGAFVVRAGLRELAERFLVDEVGD